MCLVLARILPREKGRDDRCLHAAPTLNVKVFDDTLVKIWFNFIKKIPFINKLREMSKIKFSSLYDNI